ncbi:MAG: hypothetical protein WAZ77_22400, partial [Candidatus Nitrosopolaris sp.]
MAHFSEAIHLYSISESASHEVLKIYEKLSIYSNHDKFIRNSLERVQNRTLSNTHIFYRLRTKYCCCVRECCGDWNMQ